MIVLFLNLHKPTPDGESKFQRYYTTITKILRQTIYYGTHFEQQIRTKDQLSDYLYDDIELAHKEKARAKFQSVGYVFIDGPVSIPPWSPSMNDVALLIRNCLAEGKKVHFNGYGHLACYYFISTGFDKDYCIRKKGENVTGKEDYFHEEDTGDLYAHGKKVCNSGIKVAHINNRFFQSKSVQAVGNGAVLPTKFHYLAFSSKNGDAVINSVNFPFTFFCKYKVFCVSVLSTRAKIVSLVETEDRVPIVFLYENAFSTHLLCPQTIVMFKNWITKGQEVAPFREIKIQSEIIPQMAYNNVSTLKATRNFSNNLTVFSRSETQRRSADILRVQSASSSKSKFPFEKPSVRCSGPYDTFDHMKLVQQNTNKSRLLGRSRMMFRSEMEKSEIKNYVQRTPSRPPSAHVFRQTDKSKWLDKKTFFVT